MLLDTYQQSGEELSLFDSEQALEMHRCFKSMFPSKEAERLVAMLEPDDQPIRLDDRVLTSESRNQEFTANFYTSVGATGGDDFVKRFREGTPTYSDHPLNGPKRVPPQIKVNRAIRQNSCESMVEYLNMQQIEERGGMASSQGGDVLSDYGARNESPRQSHKKLLRSVGGSNQKGNLETDLRSSQ
jgi:hypothetical protein